SAGSPPRQVRTRSATGFMEGSQGGPGAGKPDPFWAEGPGDPMNALQFSPTTVSVDLGGAPISIETGRIAKQAAGSVIVRQGDTMVLVAVCRAAPREGIDFFPLTVDYRESVFATGKIPGG